MGNDVAGNPMSQLKWTRKSLSKIVKALATIDILVSRNTVRTLLKSMDFSLKTNQKVISGKTKMPKTIRNQQFLLINKLRDQFSKEEKPVISVDSKKTEVVGNFKNAGVKWERGSTKVHDHDFRSLGNGLGIPYGVYDVNANKGSVFIGQYHNTPRFAVEAIETWWKNEGQIRYPHAKEIFILADNGGSNGSIPRAWKYNLQMFCDRSGLTVRVSHYPSGASKWNPIEHRLFSEVSKNWAAQPLVSHETMLKYIRTTTTVTGLTVTAQLMRKKYPKGEKISDAEMASLQIEREEFLPNLNYVLSPRM